MAMIPMARCYYCGAPLKPESAACGFCGSAVDPLDVPLCDSETSAGSIFAEAPVQQLGEVEYPPLLPFDEVQTEPGTETAMSESSGAAAEPAAQEEMPGAAEGSAETPETMANEEENGPGQSENENRAPGSDPEEPAPVFTESFETEASSEDGAEQSAIDQEESKAEQPAAFQEESEAEQPAIDQEESEAEQPAIDQEESEAEQPATFQEKSEAEQPDEIQEESEAEQPAIDQEESEAEQPAAFQEESEAEQPAIDQKESEAEQPAAVQEESETEEPSAAREADPESGAETEKPQLEEETEPERMPLFMIRALPGQNQSCVIEKYIGGPADVLQIPCEIDGQQVKALGRSAFAHCMVREIVLPDSLQSIDDYAFTGCITLQSIAGGAGIREIGRGIFNGCINLKKCNFLKNRGIHRPFDAVIDRIISQLNASE